SFVLSVKRLDWGCDERTPIPTQHSASRGTTRDRIPGRRCFVKSHRGWRTDLATEVHRTPGRVSGGNKRLWDVNAIVRNATQKTVTRPRPV
ncbi:hypothetical protein SOVF_175680, partial [Spinacia oleracea]